MNPRSEVSRRKTIRGWSKGDDARLKMTLQIVRSGNIVFGNSRRPVRFQRDVIIAGLALLRLFAQNPSFRRAVIAPRSSIQ